jgi:DNA repair protein RadC
MLPREKFLKMGIDSLSDEDLVSILISCGVKGISFDILSKKVLKILKKNKFSFENLQSLKGLGKVKSIQLLCAVELGKRIYGYSCEKTIISNTEMAFNQLKYLVNKKQEHLVALFLNARYELLERKTVSIGTVDSLNIFPRDIIIASLKANSAFVILAHNHPSGVSKPSKEDAVVNERIKSALNLVGIKLLDHIVVSSEGWCSID